jgi:DNA-binding transcriptional regulator YhcF (GntR family)
MSATLSLVTQQPNSEEFMDARRPGFCWQDNELYDVYQPIIGAHGVVLYANLSRKAHGDECSYSLRILAAETGLDVVTIQRLLAMLATIGMVRMTSGVCGSVDGTLDLVDLKDLAEAHGAQPVQNRRSHVLSAERAEELRRQCEALMQARS